MKTRWSVSTKESYKQIANELNEKEVSNSNHYPTISYYYYYDRRVTHGKVGLDILHTYVDKENKTKLRLIYCDSLRGRKSSGQEREVCTFHQSRGKS